jgi:hypothetical protein
MECRYDVNGDLLNNVMCKIWHSGSGGDEKSSYPVQLRQTTKKKTLCCSKSHWLFTTRHGATSQRTSIVISTVVTFSYIAVVIAFTFPSPSWCCPTPCGQCPSWCAFWALSQNCDKRLLALLYPSVLSHWTTSLPLDGFWWNLIFNFFQKSVKKLQISLKSDWNDWYFTWRSFHVYENVSLNCS